MRITIGKLKEKLTQDKISNRHKIIYNLKFNNC